MDKTLILTVGLPRSGKTTWAKRSGYPIVNPDAIRLALHGQRFQALAEGMVWAITKIMVRALFLAGHNMVILDATNITPKRLEWDHDPTWVIKYKLFDADATTCIARAKKIGDEQIIPVIIRMAGEMDISDIKSEQVIDEC
jgi:predicted kinase